MLVSAFVTLTPVVLIDCHVGPTFGVGGSANLSTLQHDNDNYGNSPPLQVASRKKGTCSERLRSGKPRPAPCSHAWLKLRNAACSSLPACCRKHAAYQCLLPVYDCELEASSCSQRMVVCSQRMVMYDANADPV